MKKPKTKNKNIMNMCVRFSFSIIKQIDEFQFLKS